MQRTIRLGAILRVALALGLPALAQDAPPARSGADVKYSPYPEQDRPS